MAVPLMIPDEFRSALDAAGGDPVRVIDPKTNSESVLVRVEDYAKVEGLIYDDSPLTIDEQRAVLGHIGKRIGWDDPEMDVYDELDPRRQS